MKWHIYVTHIIFIQFHMCNINIATSSDYSFITVDNLGSTLFFPKNTIN